MDLLQIGMKLLAGEMSENHLRESESLVVMFIALCEVIER